MKSNKCSEITDREKVIKGLRICSTQKGCHGCPYESMSGLKCSSMLKRDALELLKEQDKQIIELKEKLRLMEYGNQDAEQSLLMPAT